MQDETTISEEMIDIIPNKIAYESWLARRTGNNKIAKVDTLIHDGLYERSFNKDSVTSNVITTNGTKTAIGVSKDPRNDGYDAYGFFETNLPNKNNPIIDINWIDMVVNGVQLGERMVITPQSVRFGKETFYISYKNDGSPMLCSNKFGVVKTLNDGVDVHPGLFNVFTMRSHVESMVVENNSLIVKMTNGVTYRFDSNLLCTITKDDNRYMSKTVDDEHMSFLFEEDMRPDLSGTSYRLLHYDEETSTGVGVENRFNKVILINYNNPEKFDYKARSFDSLNSSIFINKDKCSGYVHGDYFVIRDRDMAYSIFRIDRIANEFSLIATFAPPDPIVSLLSGDVATFGDKSTLNRYQGEDDESAGELLASFIYFDGGIFIPNGLSIYRVDVMSGELTKYDVRFYVKQLFEFDGIFFALCHDTFTDMNTSPANNMVRLYDGTFVTIVDFKEGIVNSISETGDINDIGIMHPISELMSMDMFCVGPGSINHNNKVNTSAGTFYSACYLGNAMKFIGNSKLQVINGIPYFIKNDVKTPLLFVIGDRDRRSSVSMSANTESIKSSKNLNFVHNDDERVGDDAISSLLSQKDGIIRDFNNDTFYDVTKIMGCHYIVHDSYTGRKRIDIAAKDGKLTTTFLSINTDRYIVNISKDIDPKISMYLDSLRPDEFDRLCSNIIENPFI